MRHLPVLLLAGGVLAAAPLHAQQEPPERNTAQATTQVQAPAHADTPAPAAARDDVFERARRLVAAGQGDTGRNLIQSELNAADSGSARYVEALYWRAVLAQTAADAERDLRTIVIEYPLSPESDDALMRLAQLEMTRGENEQAIGHLERVVREHPRSASRPRASFWMARMYFDKGKAAEACRHLADASANVPVGQVELRNQVDYLMPRCAGMDMSAPAAAAQPAASPNAARPSTSAPASQEFTVQVAAFTSHESAEKLSVRLKELGYVARITSDEPPYRVRVGRYSTREAADSVVARMKAQHVDGYVTSAEPRR